MRAAVLAGLLVLGACHPSGQGAGSQVSPGRISAEPVTLTAADGVKIDGVYTQVEHPRALILLFHQDRSGKDEYALIAPRLAQSGFASLRIDQRVGGDLFGGNPTAQRLGKRVGYLDAKPDLVAALGWAKPKKLPVILWGSSYSASLAVLLAAERPDAVAGALAFSPAEYFGDRNLLARAAAKTRTPLFVTSAQDGREIDAARGVIEAAPAETKVQFIPKLGGVHGSSTLLREHNPNGAEPAWKAVLAFLDSVAVPAR
ncbi:alpha/beta hydrolase [Sphingomonas xinjiangensis]|uniref:Dienelactone hydrolase n=1 Tax=Sphingomonas xinjiangensis TaxID=643568 RepID=A0A840Y9R2_9SPHN|nr:alpha/beta hydrolase [Sphingomonas xinjiangensis]MBB5709584.1 dienelactone hydrolase [Sphingomonas xinjiangensis]